MGTLDLQQVSRKHSGPRDPRLTSAGQALRDRALDLWGLMLAPGRWFQNRTAGAPADAQRLKRVVCDAPSPHLASEVV